MDGDEAERIARREGDDTFESISNLDDICDTNLIALTFLLAALASWTVFAFDRFEQFQRMAPLRGAYVALVAVCALTIAGSVFFHVKSLAPRGFYGDALGDPFLTHWWEILLDDDTADTESFESRIADVSDADELDSQFEAWFRDEYAPNVTVESARQYEFARLLNYKAVARIKAKYTAYGVSLLRVSVALTVTVILLSVAGQYVVPLLR